MRIRLLFLPAALALAAAAAAVSGCGGSASASGPAPPATTAAKHAVVKTRHGALGTFLVDGSGRTLYLFEKDRGPRSTCAGDCATDWPPLITRGKPQAGSGVTASRLTTTRRAGGSRQVVYNGHPLYRYAPDTAGKTTGQGVSAFGALWYVVAPAGRAITAAAPSGTGTPAPSTY
jgi:predicted lipoprotein with Yx(FWY)xxD motif